MDAFSQTEFAALRSFRKHTNPVKIPDNPIYESVAFGWLVWKTKAARQICVGLIDLFTIIDYLHGILGNVVFDNVLRSCRF